jgi:hypothetical protein
VDWIGLAQNRDQMIALVMSVMILRAPYNFGKFLSRSKTEGLLKGLGPCSLFIIIINSK